MRLTAELVGRFEQHMAEAVESLLTQSLTVPGNPEGYAAFHTIVWSPLPVAVGPAPAVDIREVSTEAEMDAHIDIQLAAYDIPPAIIDRLRPLRRTWRGTKGRRFYLAYVHGQPAAQSMLYWSGEVGYLESAGMLPAFRRRGLQLALVRRRIADTTALGCRVIFGAAEFASQSLANQIACGLSVAYVAARWSQRAR